MGHDVEIKCDSLTSVKWMWQDEEISKFPRNTKLTSKNALIIDRVTVDNRGIYKCKGSEKGGIFYAEAILKVKGKWYLQATLF